MSERIFIGVAWPYANGLLHLGHLAGAYLPADIFARYHRIKRNEVLMVSGSDRHGTAITIRAEQEGKSPEEIADKYHDLYKEAWQKIGITWDLYTSTGTANHAEVTHDIFLNLLNKGYIYKSSTFQPYCPSCRRFLPDRYVEGSCPHCHDPGARGDQCDECGKPLSAAELLNPRCRQCGTQPEFRETEHFFLKLSAFQEQLKAWVSQQSHWRANVRNFTLGFLEEGLHDRAITRDIDWGVSVPIAGFEDKRIYVWFENIIGYLSASKEWAKSSGNPEAWRAFWQGDTKSYYFIGKDNIVFHTMNWPAMLMGYGGLNLPYDVPANEFLTIESKKVSKSRGLAPPPVLDCLSRYDPDPLRYYFSANMPEMGDSDFTWADFIRRNNDELVATYGNLVNRVLTFTYRNFEGKVPQPQTLDGESRTLLKKSEETLSNVSDLLYRCHFREAVRVAMVLAQETNRYLDEKAPWKTIKENRESAATALYVAICVISCLKTVFYPFLPFSSQKVHEYLGFEGRVEDSGWQMLPMTPGQKLREPKALFVKLDKALAEEESSRLGQAH
ncbi:MAG: methionine--tRNA ligase [Chloroflexi bacterium]|nr:methionine--tRNA ligase [Chloroflexota bacterium]